MNAQPGFIDLGTVVANKLLDAAKAAARQGDAMFTYDGDTGFRLTFPDGYYEATTGLPFGDAKKGWIPVLVDTGERKSENALFIRYRWVPVSASAAAA